MPMFHSGQCDHPESEPKFRIQAMISHLQRDIGIRYHTGRIAEHSAFEAVDHFLHGIFLSDGGTCGNMPVLYTAVGRKLDYPLVLVGTRSHLFCRWDGRERFNIEGAGEGVSFVPDEHYYSGRFEMPPETVKACGYLESQPPRVELGGFISQRAHCWMDLKNYQEAASSFAWANELAPDPTDPTRRNGGMFAFLTWQALREWDKELHSRLPGRMFPKLDIGIPPAKFRRLPRELEKEMIRLRVQQSIMDDPEYERLWWGPMRKYPFTRPPKLPEVLRVDFRWNELDRRPVYSTHAV